MHVPTDCQPGVYSIGRIHWFLELGTELLDCRSLLREKMQSFQRPTMTPQQSAELLKYCLSNLWDLAKPLPTALIDLHLQGWPGNGSFTQSASPCPPVNPIVPQLFGYAATFAACQQPVNCQGEAANSLHWRFSNFFRHQVPLIKVL